MPPRGCVSRVREDAMTNDDERVAYLAGEEGTEVDDLSRADLDELMALLGDADVWAEPGDHLEDAVVAAIAAEGARTPPGRGAASGHSATAARRTWTGQRAGRRSRPPPRSPRSPSPVCVVSRSGDDVVGRGEPRGTDVARRQWTARLSQTDSGWRIELDAERPAPARRRSLLPGVAEERRRRARRHRDVQRARRRRAVGRRAADGVPHA